MIILGFSKEIVVVRWVFIKIEFSWVKRRSVRQPVVTRNSVVAVIEWSGGGVSRLTTWFMFLHET